MTTSYQDRQIECVNIASAAHRRAETLLIAAMILVFAILLEPHMAGLDRFLKKLPQASEVIGHGIRSALIS